MAFLMNFGPKMEPECLHKWFQNLSKINTFTRGLHFGVPDSFWLHFGSILVSILLNFGAHFDTFGKLFEQSDHS